MLTFHFHSYFGYFCCQRLQNNRCSVILLHKRGNNWTWNHRWWEKSTFFSTQVTKRSACRLFEPAYIQQLSHSTAYNRWRPTSCELYTLLQVIDKQIQKTADLKRSFGNFFAHLVTEFAPLGQMGENGKQCFIYHIAPLYCPLSIKPMIYLWALQYKVAHSEVGVDVGGSLRDFLYKIWSEKQQIETGLSETFVYFVFLLIRGTNFLRNWSSIGGREILWIHPSSLTVSAKYAAGCDPIQLRTPFSKSQCHQRTSYILCKERFPRETHQVQRAVAGCPRPVSMTRTWSYSTPLGNMLGKRLGARISVFQEHRSPTLDSTRLKNAILLDLIQTNMGKQLGWL